MDTQRLRSLLDKREQIDRDIVDCVKNGETTKKAITCSHCGDEGHTARTCPKKQPEQPAANPFAGQ